MSVRNRVSEADSRSAVYASASACSHTKFLFRRMCRFLFVPARRGRGRLLGLLVASLLLTVPLQAQSTGASTGTLTVDVDGLSSNKGTVRIELTTEETYDTDGHVRADALPIHGKQARWTVTDVPHGTYAVRLYHDEDDDGELDTNLFGVPQEAFGFSNNARGSMGPPDFRKAAVVLDTDSLSTTITAE